MNYTLIKKHDMSIFVLKTTLNNKQLPYYTRSPRPKQRHPRGAPAERPLSWANQSGGAPGDLSHAASEGQDPLEVRYCTIFHWLVVGPPL